MEPPLSLAAALESQDAVAVALALRNGTATVPLLPFGPFSTFV